MARYHFFRTDTKPIQKVFFLNQCIISISDVTLSDIEFVRPAHHSFVFYMQSTKYRQLYCKEKQQINGYVIIIYDKLRYNYDTN